MAPERCGSPDLRRTRYDYGRVLKGGIVDYVVRASTTGRIAVHAVESFATNAPPRTQTRLFAGSVRIPDSPQPGAGWKPWAKINSFVIPFTTPFVYRGNTLCLDIEGRQRVARLPDFWYLAAIRVPSRGKSTNFGRSCTTHQTVRGYSIHAQDNGLVIGGMLSAVIFGRVDCRPMVLIGAVRDPTGIDLTPMGATGCRQYVIPFAIIPTPYSYVSKHWPYRMSGILTQVPVDRNLLGARFYMQGMESQIHLPRKAWENPAGLTLTDGLEIQLAAQASSLGISVVESRHVDKSAPLPTRGDVNPEWVPVMRLLYR